MRNLPLLPAFSLYFFFACVSPLVAQDEPVPMKYGFISEDDLRMKVYPPDTSAAAVILCDYGKVLFEPSASYTFTRHTRIKFLRRSGFSYGDIVIPYVDGMQVRNLKAQVLAPDGKTIEVDKKDVFDEKVNNYGSRRIRFALPNLQEGSVAEYKYDLASKYIFQLPEWYFQGAIPVRWNEMRLVIPTWFQYISLMNGRPPDVSETILGQESLLGETSNIRFVMKEVPALQEEAFITTMDDYYSHIRFQLKSYQTKGEVLEQVMSTWEETAKKLLKEYDEFGGQITKKSKYKKTWEAAQPLLAGIISPEEKIRVLYNFVQSSFERENYYWRYAREDLDDLFEKKSATPSEMNLLLIALLREADLQADPVLISTRDHGQPVPDYPFLDQFNHVLVSVKKGDETMLLDAGSSFRPPGLVAINSLNHKGWKVHVSSPQWIPIDPVPASETYFGSFQLDEDGNLKGKVQVAEEGYSAMNRREKYYAKLADEYWKTEIQKRYPDASLDSVTVENKDDFFQPLREKFNCNLPAYGQVSGDFIYMNPAFYSTYYENPFKTEHRTYPVDMAFPFRERVVCDFTVPPSYKIESLPESARLTLPNNGGRFQYVIEHRAGKITLNCSLNITQLYFDPAEYDGLRSFFGMIAEKLGEQVVLKKE